MQLSRRLSSTSQTALSGSWPATMWRPTWCLVTTSSWAGGASIKVTPDMSPLLPGPAVHHWQDESWGRHPEIQWLVSWWWDSGGHQGGASKGRGHHQGVCTCPLLRQFNLQSNLSPQSGCSTKIQQKQTPWREASQGSLVLHWVGSPGFVEEKIRNRMEKVKMEDSQTQPPEGSPLITLPWVPPERTEHSSQGQKPDQLMSWYLTGLGARTQLLDVTVINPLQTNLVAQAATTPGHALNVAYNRKMIQSAEACRLFTPFFSFFFWNRWQSLSGVGTRVLWSRLRSLAQPWPGTLGRKNRTRSDTCTRALLSPWSRVMPPSSLTGPQPSPPQI